jgi:hypothetical protein
LLIYSRVVALSYSSVNAPNICGYSKKLSFYCHLNITTWKGEYSWGLHASGLLQQQCRAENHKAAVDVRHLLGTDIGVFGCNG